MDFKTHCCVEDINKYFTPTFACIYQNIILINMIQGRIRVTGRVSCSSGWRRPIIMVYIFFLIKAYEFTVKIANDIERTVVIIVNS